MCSEKQDPLYEAFVEWCREKGITPEQAGLLARLWSLREQISLAEARHKSHPS